MKGVLFAVRFVVKEHGVGERMTVLTTRRMNEHACRLVDDEKRRVLIENLERNVFGRDAALFRQMPAKFIAALDAGSCGVGGASVQRERARTPQFLPERRGEAALLLQKLPKRHTSQSFRHDKPRLSHAITSFSSNIAWRSMVVHLHFVFFCFSLDVDMKFLYNIRRSSSFLEIL